MLRGLQCRSGAHILSNIKMEETAEKFVTSSMLTSQCDVEVYIFCLSSRAAMVYYMAGLHTWSNFDLILLSYGP